MDSTNEEILKRKVPYVRKQERKRNNNGTWRKKRSDAGTKRIKPIIEEEISTPSVL